MKKIIFLLFVLGGGLIIYKVSSIYLAFCWAALCFVYAFLEKKMSRREALLMMFLVLAYLAIMFGGFIIIENSWSEFAASIWVVICIILLPFLSKKMIKLFPTIFLANLFQEIVTKKINADQVSKSSPPTKKTK